MQFRVVLAVKGDCNSRTVFVMGTQCVVMGLGAQMKLASHMHVATRLCPSVAVTSQAPYLLVAGAQLELP